MSRNMRVSVILEINGCLPCVVGTKGSTTLKLKQTPFSKLLLYMENICILPRGISKIDPACVKKIALCK
jgi:hypothetical protein